MPLRAQDLPTLTLSLPAQIESFPIAFAADEQQNLFPDFGLNVVLSAFSNNANRNLALFTGEIDGFMGDISSVVSLVSNGTPVEITSTAYESIDGSRRYTLTTHNFSFITELEQLFPRLGQGDRDFIGLIRASDMEYKLDLLVESLEMTVDEQGMYSGFQDIVDLATTVAIGSWLAGVLPEPMGSYLQFITEASGTPVVVLSEFQDIECPPTVLAFQSQFIEQQPQVIENFYSGYRQVLDDLRNTERDTVIDIGIDAALEFFFPGLTRESLPPGGEEFLASYVIPSFPDPRELKSSEYSPVAGWNVSKGFVQTPVPFETVSNSQFI